MNFRHLKAQMGIMGRVLLLALRRLDDGFATAARTGDRLENAAAEEANKAHYDEHAVNYENLPDVFRLGSQWVSDSSPRMRW